MVKNILNFPKVIYVHPDNPEVSIPHSIVLAKKNYSTSCSIALKTFFQSISANCSWQKIKKKIIKNYFIKIAINCFFLHLISFIHWNTVSLIITVSVLDHWSVYGDHIFSLLCYEVQIKVDWLKFKKNA